MTSCPNCEYSGNLRGLSGHWRFNESHRPKFTEKQEDIIIGLLMGDGSINTGSSNCKIQCNSITLEYLEYLYNEFYPLSSKPKLRATAEQLAENNRNTGFDENANAETYSDSYFWHTLTHPELNKFNSWYNEDKKVWPRDINLNSTILKHWYVGDGHYNRESNRIQLSMNNESENNKKVETYFQDIRNISIDYWNKNERSGKMECIAQFNADTSDELFEFMGEPLPGFEYKWPERFK